ncbi:MAG: hypothetical protein ABI651_13380 [Verrucomicrobiota bacterium]
MSGRTDDLSSPIRIEVMMDGKPLELPEHVRGSLTAIRSYLESLALQHGRVVSFFTVDAIIINIMEESSEIRGMQRVNADTISFDELTRQLISTACDRLKHLHATAEGIITQVLINDWPEVQKLWESWQPDFKSPILVVNFLRELCGVRLDELRCCNQSLGQHLTFFNALIDELEAVVATKNILEFSNFLEERYAPWLQRLSVFLRQLEER